MAGTTCNNCGGKGSALAGIKFNMSYSDIHDQIAHGDRSYKTCDVCNGTGSVSFDKAYYTHDPSASLENARRLFQRHGKPVAIYVPTQVDEVWAKFADGTQHAFGAFGIGYVGTRPGNFKLFLEMAGIPASTDEIAAMQAPCLLKAGFTPPRTVRQTGATLAEAQANARRVIPQGAEVLSEQLDDDGEPRTIESEDRLLDDAWRVARSRLPPDGIIEEERVLMEAGRQGRVSAWGRHFGKTEERLASRIPPGAKLGSFQAKNASKKLLFWVSEERDWFVPAKVQIRFRRPITWSVTFLQKR